MITLLVVLQCRSITYYKENQLEYDISSAAMVLQDVMCLSVIVPAPLFNLLFLCLCTFLQLHYYVNVPLLMTKYK